MRANSGSSDKPLMKHGQLLKFDLNEKQKGILFIMVNIIRSRNQNMAV